MNKLTPKNEGGFSYFFLWPTYGLYAGSIFVMANRIGLGASALIMSAIYFSVIAVVMKIFPNLGVEKQHLPPYKGTNNGWEVAPKDRPAQGTMLAKDQAPLPKLRPKYSVH